MLRRDPFWGPVLLFAGGFGIGRQLRFDCILPPRRRAGPNPAIQSRLKGCQQEDAAKEATASEDF
jgi:hypothetical protein